MREIKFRAKERSGEWHVGSLFVEDGMGIPYIVSGVNTHYETNYLTVEVVLETVGQFTGLKDHKGREIYEGDIVKVVNDGEESFHVVKYMVEEDYPAFDLDPVLNDGECNSLSYSLNALDTKIIVIGNIYDNPELLRLTKK